MLLFGTVPQSLLAAVGGICIRRELTTTDGGAFVPYLGRRDEGAE